MTEAGSEISEVRHFREALEAGGIGTWEWDLPSGRMHWSREMFRLLGLPVERAAAGPEALLAAVRPEERAAAEEQIARLRSRPGPVRLELSVPWPSGETHWIVLLGRTEADAAGSPVRMLGIAIDGSLRHQIEEALRESDAQLRDLLRTIDLATVFVRDMRGRIRFWSRGCERLYGWTAEEALGRSAHELLGTVFPNPPAEIEQTLRSRGEWEGDVVHRRRDGRMLIVSLRKVLRRNDAGEPVAVLESAADVTRLREVEAQLRSLNEELEARVRTEVAARDAAQARAAQAERMQALGLLAGGIAHDFNNVLQAVQGAAALIGQRAHDPSAAKRLAGLIQDAANRGASVTRRLLAFARHGDLRAEPVDPAALLEGMREVLASTLGARIEVRVEVSAGLPAILADKGQLETALVNLATNARDAMPDGGTLVLAAAEEVIEVSRVGHPADLAPGRYLRFSVADNGQGMDAMTLGRALEPFFTTKPPGLGTGLGLPMVKGFAEQSGGALAVQSQLGIGTTVSLWLPHAGAGARRATLRAGGEAAAAGSLRVLLVDDEPLVLELLAAELEVLGYSVLVASSGEEAQALIAAGEPLDALVTDFSMPGIDGVSLIRAAQAERSGLPAVLLTGYVGEGATLAAGGTRGGRFSLLRKPVTGEQIADSLAALLEAAAPSA